MEYSINLWSVMGLPLKMRVSESDLSVILGVTLSSLFLVIGDWNLNPRRRILSGLALCIGLVGLVSAGDAFSWLLCSQLSFVAVLVLNRDHFGADSSRIFWVVLPQFFGETLLLIMFVFFASLHHQEFGYFSMAFESLAKVHFQEAQSISLFIVGLMGLALRCGIFPFHSWVVHAFNRGEGKLPLPFMLYSLVLVYSGVKFFPGFFPDEFSAFRVALHGILGFGVLYGLISFVKQASHYSVWVPIVCLCFVFQFLVLVGCGDMNPKGFSLLILSLMVSAALLWVLDRRLKQVAHKPLIYNGSILYLRIFAYCGLVGFPGTVGHQAYKSIALSESASLIGEGGLVIWIGLVSVLILGTFLASPSCTGHVKGSGDEKELSQVSLWVVASMFVGFNFAVLFLNL